MAKYRLLSRVEHDLKLYVPASAWPEGAKKSAVSGGHGREIEVDDSGEIELSNEQAAPLLAMAAVELVRPKKADQKK